MTMTVSKRKPHNDTAGYVCERKLPKGRGHLVLLDRKNGGDWVDAEERWVLILIREEKVFGTIGIVSRAVAYDIMKAETAGADTGIDWCEDYEDILAREHEMMDEAARERAAA